MLKQKYFLTDFFILSAEKQPIKSSWRKIEWLRKVPQLLKMASTVMAYRTGILAWYGCHISTRKEESINNKIKVLKRSAYGFRDE